MGMISAGAGLVNESSTAVSLAVRSLLASGRVRRTSRSRTLVATRDASWMQRVAEEFQHSLLTDSAVAAIGPHLDVEVFAGILQCLD
jgi:hypothetical protein